MLDQRRFDEREWTIESILLTFFNFLPREIGAALGRPCHHISEADSEAQELVIVVGGERLRRQSAQVEAFPWKPTIKRALKSNLNVSSRRERNDKQNNNKKRNQDIPILCQWVKRWKLSFRCFQLSFHVFPLSLSRSSVSAVIFLFRD